MKANRMIVGLALLVAFSTGAAAQTVQPMNEPSPAAPWKQTIGSQLVTLLSSPSVEVRQRALQLAMYLSARYGEQADLTAVVPALVAVYRTDGNEQHRIAAAVALRGIGDEGGMQRLRSAVYYEPVGRVQFVTLALLMDFYGPETFERDEKAATMAEVLHRQYRAAPAAVVAYSGR